MADLCLKPLDGDRADLVTRRSLSTVSINHKDTEDTKARRWFRTNRQFFVIFVTLWFHL